MLKHIFNKFTTPPYKQNLYICHAELVSVSYNLETLKQVQGDRTSLKDCIYKKCAFTLAEVLITLVIIGVIAAITVPTLITKYQKEQTVVRVKKVYSTLMQSYYKSRLDNGTIDTWDIVGVSNYGAGDAIRNIVKKYILPYVNTAKFCNRSVDCTKISRVDLQNTENGLYSGHNENFPALILADGTYVYFFMFNNCIRAYFDINGDKKPNMWAKDYFQFSYCHNGEIGFPGINSTRAQILPVCNKTIGSPVAGSRCSALIQKDGWRISDDYPW